MKSKNEVVIPKMKCRKCKDGYLDERVKRDAIVKYVLFWLPLKRFRCFNCSQKSYLMAP